MGIRSCRVAALAFAAATAEAFAPTALPTSRPARSSASAISGLKMTGVVPNIEREPVYGLRPNEKGGIWVPQRARPRRNRKNEPIRSMTRENRYFVFHFFLYISSRVICSIMGKSHSGVRIEFTENVT